MEQFSRIEEIRARIQRDYAVDRSDRDFLLHYLQVNLSEFRKSLDDYINAENWDQLAWGGDFLKAVGTNLGIGELRQVGTAMAEGARKHDEELVSRTVASLDAVLAELRD